MNTPKKTVALLIDGDNAQLHYTKQIMQFCKGYGILRIKNAHGDWKQRPLYSHCQKISELGVTCVQQDRDGKNATDRSLKRDVDLMLAKGDADIYVIASGDGHFASTCKKIHQKGAKVIVIGSESNTSLKLLTDFVEFHGIEDIIENQSEASTKPPLALKQPSTVRQPKPTTILKKLTQAYQETPLKDGWAYKKQFEKAMLHLDKSFVTRWSKKQIWTWFNDLKEFELEGHYVRMK